MSWALFGGVSVVCAVAQSVLTADILNLEMHGVCGGAGALCFVQWTLWGVNICMERND